MEYNLANYRNLITKGEITKEEEISLLLDNSRTSTDELVKSHIKLVVSMAARYSRKGFPIEDLIQEGIIALYEAVEEYKNKGDFENCRYSSFAKIWARGRMSNYMREHCNLIKIPEYIIANISKLRRSGEIENLDKIEEFQKRIPKIVSIDAPKTDDGEDNFLNLEDDSIGTFESVVKLDEIEKIKNIVKNLPYIYRTVIEKRYGLNGNKEMTLKEMGVLLNISNERIRQIQIDSENYIRKLLNKR